MQPFFAEEKLAAKAVYLFTFYPRPEGRGNNRIHNYIVAFAYNISGQGISNVFLPSPIRRPAFCRQGGLGPTKAGFRHKYFMPQGEVISFPKPELGKEKNMSDRNV